MAGFTITTNINNAVKYVNAIAKIEGDSASTYSGAMGAEVRERWLFKAASLFQQQYFLNATAPTAGLRYGSDWQSRWHLRNRKPSAVTFDPKQGWKDRRGRRMVTFFFPEGGRRTGSFNVASLHSYPLNMWENNVTYTRNFGPWGPGRPRTGLGIFRYLAGQAEHAVPKAVEKGNLWVKKRFDKEKIEQ